MNTQDKKNLYLQLFGQFLIFAVSLIIFIINSFLVPFLIFFDFIDVVCCIFAFGLVIVSFFSLCIFCIYPLTAFSMYKLIKFKPLSKFQETCLKIFPKLFIPVVFEIPVLIIWLVLPD